MPALITHYLFGEELLNRGAAGQLADDAAASPSARRAFFLGCQGPDPFFFRITGVHGKTVRALASAMHHSYVSRTFDQLRSCATGVPAQDASIARAFAGGLLAHYVLDRTMHPFVYSMNYGLCDTTPDLHDAYSEVHALIESEIDCGLLDVYRGLSVKEFAPVNVLKADESALQVAGMLMAGVAQAVYGLALPTREYGAAVGNQRMCFCVNEPYGAALPRCLGRVERMLRPHSILMGLAHRVDQKANNASMNAGRARWTNPFTGDVLTKSAVELFEQALADYSRCIGPFMAGEKATLFTKSIDYNGRLLGEGESPAPSRR